MSEVGRAVGGVGPRQQRGRRAALRWSALVACVAGVLVGLIGPQLGAGAAAPAPTAPADAALDWLEAQMAANGGTIAGFTAGSTDWGVTADAILALIAAGRGSDPAAVTATDLLAANAGAYTTWTSGADTVQDAGATGKSVLVLRAMGRPAVAQGVDLEAALRSMMVTSGPEAGRFSDVVPEPAWNAAHGFAQALSILGLALTDGGVPEPAVRYLLLQQCPSGGFRLHPSGSVGCESDEQVDTDATALALQALLVADRTPAVSTALERGTAWLLVRQGADGSYGGAGPTAPANANSAGLAAQYLRTAGQTAAADRAAAWIASCCQLTATNAAGTPAAPHVGGIAYNPAALSTALGSGVSTGAADQWRRTTSQAVLAFGLSPYGPQDVEPLPPVTTTTTASTTTSTTTTTTGPTTTTTSDATTTSIAPITTAPSGIDPQVEGEQLAGGAAPVSYEVSGSASPSPSSSGSPALARTGTDPVLALGVAALLLAVGSVLAVAGRRDER